MPPETTTPPPVTPSAPVSPPRASRRTLVIMSAVVAVLILAGIAAGAYFTGLLSPFFSHAPVEQPSLGRSFVLTQQGTTTQLFMQSGDAYEPVNLGTILPIIFMARRDGHVAYVTSAEGSAYEIRVDTQVRYYTQERQIFSAATSPDASRVVFAATDFAITTTASGVQPASMKIYLVGTDGRSQEEIGMGTMPFFRTDTNIVWLSEEGLISYDLTTKEKKVLTTEARPSHPLFISPSVSPDGSMIGWGAVDGIHIFRVTATGAEQVAVYKLVENIQLALGNDAFYVFGQQGSDAPPTTLYRHTFTKDEHGTPVLGLPIGTITNFIP